MQLFISNVEFETEFGLEILIEVLQKLNPRYQFYINHTFNKDCPEQNLRTSSCLKLIAIV